MGIIKDCKNLEESYGQICVLCNKCGRFDKKISTKDQRIAELEKENEQLRANQNKIAIEKLEEIKDRINLELDCSYGSLQIKVIEIFDTMLKELKVVNIMFPY